MESFDVFASMNSQGLFLVSSTLVLLLIIFFMYKTYRTSLHVEERLAAFSSLTDSSFGRKLRLIEVNADEYKINKSVLGPLARIIDEYCVLTTDNKGVITYANDKFLALSGFDFRDLIGQHESIHHPENQQHDSPHRMQSRLAKAGVWNGEVYNKGKAGKFYWMNLFIFPLSYITDEDEGYIFFGTDITQIKSENSELQQAVKDKDQKINQVENMLLHSEKMASLGTISAGIAHEINNPMAVLSANTRRGEQYLSAMAAVVRGVRERIEPSRFEQFLEVDRNINLTRAKLDFILEDYPSLMDETASSIERIKKIICDLKHFSHNKQEDYAPVNIADCVDVSLNLARHELKSRIKVQTHFEPDLPQVKASESQLSQVLVNLLVNAAQAIEGEGRIIIRAEKRDKWYCLTMTDNGPGIEKEKLEKIFEPFFTTKPIGQGTGLGLSISQDIIQRHGGSLTANSRVGEGTAFEIRLPLADKNEAHAA